MTHPKCSILLLAAASSVALVTAGCSKKADTQATDAVAVAPVATTPAAGPQMQTVLDKLASLGGKPIDHHEGRHL